MSKTFSKLKIVIYWANNLKQLNVTLSVKSRLISKSNYEITSIKIWFLPLISLYFQSLTWPYSVNIKDIKVTFSQNVPWHMKEDFFVENSKLQKNDFSWVLIERVTHPNNNTKNLYFIFIFALITAYVLAAIVFMYLFTVSVITDFQIVSSCSQILAFDETFVWSIFESITSQQ